MEITYIKRIINIREDGVTMVHGTFHYPCFRNNDIYAELANTCENYLHTTLAPNAVQEYNASPSAKKRFFFSSYNYRFEAEVLSQNDSTLTCRLTVTLSRRHTQKVLSHYENTSYIKLPEFLFLPPCKPSRKRGCRK